MNAAFCWIVTIGYCLAMVAVGFLMRIGRHVRRGDAAGAGMEFWMAQRQLPGWRLGISHTSGWMMLGWLGFGMSQVYMYGTTALWMLPIPWFILCFIVIALVPYVRRIGAVSLPQAIEKRYGPAARTLLALFSFGVFISWTQAEIFMAGNLMSPFLHVAPWVCMVILVVPILLYTWLGGFRAIVATDLIQFCVMSVFLIILAGFAIYCAHVASHGDIIGALRAAAPPTSGKGNTFNPWFLGKLFPVILMLGYLPGWLIEQDLVLRIQAARTTKQALIGAVLGLVLVSIFVLALPNITAYCALVVFPPDGAAAAAAVGNDPAKPALQIITAFINLMPMGVSLFMLMGIIACQMSTVDTFSNVTAMALAYDLVLPRFEWHGRLARDSRGSSAHARLTTARLLTFSTIILCLVCALFSNTLNDVYYISSGVLSACIAVPALFIFWKRATTPAVLAGSTAGFIATLAGYWFEYKFLQSADPKAPHYYLNCLPGFLQNSFMYNYLAAGVLLSLIVTVLVSLATQPQKAHEESAITPRPMDNYQEFLTHAAPLEPAASESRN